MGLSKPGSKPMPSIAAGREIPSLIGQDRVNVTHKVTYELATSDRDPFDAAFELTTAQAVEAVTLAKLEQQHKEVVELLDKQLFTIAHNDTTINNNLNTVIAMLQDITYRLDALEGRVNDVYNRVG